MIKSALKGIALGAILGLVTLGVVIQFTSIHVDYLMDKVGSQVVKLTPPFEYTRGGTGFAMRAPSGAVITLTNAHVCRLAQNNELHATVDGLDRYVTVRVLEISNRYDLCALTSIPTLNGLSPASKLFANEDIAVVGHPHLEPLTLQAGNTRNTEDITIMLGTNWTEEQCELAKGDYIDLAFNPVARFFGIVSACNKTYLNVVKVTARIFPGNSGSPVVNFYGSVVGVLFAGDGETNWGFIVPLSQINDFISRY